MELEQLVEQALTDADAMAVLTDWYEERGQRHWADWLRDTSFGERRRERLARALKRSGFRMREMKQRTFMLDAEFDDPFLDTLSWTVKDPTKLAALLETPAFVTARRIHLASWRPRSAIPRVLPKLAERRPNIRHLDIVEVPIALAAVRAFPSLVGLGIRLAKPARGELDVRSLCIRVSSPAELAYWAEVSTPRLTKLQIHTSAGEREWDGRDTTAAQLSAVFDRPFNAVSVDRRFYIGDARYWLDQRSPARVGLLPPRRLPDNDPPVRWTVLG